ncbi:hypothetical protein PPERSA_03390 [Pseudocohnilembus persalinus]|uniref:Uncharacterized protein n=1 Tax=Pseudocohnilembus persalinus TaxID=266149 RepID=A0A0V0QLZ4_PSEPJ|nr:hypothetical protein PPERSA_03390 [Pseudocohnilembus persalinus]|eukprot:KRX03275.1 hypothetical protein PPERSA_03390 [Pseudocohnilembus persalinus]
MRLKIENYYQQIDLDISQALNQSKKEIIQYLEEIWELIDISGYYDIQPLKELIQQYQENKINIEQFFEQQLQMKQFFENQNKFEKTINYDKNLNEAKQLIDNLQAQFNNQHKNKNKQIKMISNISQNQDEQDPMNCNKKDHFNQKYLYFKFSEKIDEILQCMTCSLDDAQMDKKIIIDQIFRFPVHKIKNFPPLKDNSDKKDIQNTMELFSREKVLKQKEEIKNQLENYYYKIEQNILQSLIQSKKEIMQHLDEMFEFVDISGIYDIEPVKEMLQQYQKKQINLQQFFDQQLEMKKKFDDQKNFKIIINQEENQKEVQTLVDNLKLQMNEIQKNFQENITINTEKIKNYHQIMNLNSKYIQFYKSFSPDNVQDEIKITNKSRRIEIDNKTKLEIKCIHSMNLVKNMKYHIKMKINFHQVKKQDVTFYLKGSNYQKQNTDITNKNYIYISDEYGQTGAYNNEGNIVQGKNFIDFWQNDETILNVVFDYNEKLFEIYDDQRQGYVKIIIDQDQIKGDKIILFINSIEQFPLVEQK